MFAKNLRYLRELKNMEQIELAELLGKKSSSTISEWEKGKYTPRIGVLNDISEIFDISISDLMNVDLSNKKENIDDEHLSVFSKLDKARKKEVHSFAQQQLKEQNNVVEFKRSDIVVDNTLAAHLIDPSKEFTDDQIDGLKAYLDKARDEYFKKHEK